MPKPKPVYKALTLRLSESNYTKLEQLSQQYGITKTAVINLALSAMSASEVFEQLEIPINGFLFGKGEDAPR